MSSRTTSVSSNLVKHQGELFCFNGLTNVTPSQSEKMSDISFKCVNG